MARAPVGEGTVIVRHCAISTAGDLGGGSMMDFVLHGSDRSLFVVTRPLAQSVGRQGLVSDCLLSVC